QLDQQIDVLNTAYQNAGFQFKRGTTDRTTDKTCFAMTPGSSAETKCKGKFTAKAANDPNKGLNLYTANPDGGVLGWSTLPWYLAASTSIDGVVILFSTFPGGTAEPYNLGYTSVHEIGHWLGLYHTFQGGCSKTNDHVTDTPQEADASFGCPTNQDTCKKD